MQGLVQNCFKYIYNRRAMTNKTAFKTIEEFLYQDGKTYVIPNYQRGYKWAVREKEKGKSAVEQLMLDLLHADREQTYFLQGVTVVENKNQIILIDGQQRTTTLYLLLWCLGKENISTIDLQYDIRAKSKDFIIELKDTDTLKPPSREDSQDIFYFKTAIQQIQAKLPQKEEDKKGLKEFILSKVTILFIVINKDKATKTFTMMNGSKATMLEEELVKAEMLRRISLPDKSQKLISSSIDENLSELKEIISNDWETNALRSRYAREWDKWLYWWNRDEVKEFYNVENPLGLLLVFYSWRYNSNKAKGQNSFSFEDFKEKLTEEKKDNKRQKTKLVFKELRDLQKLFEDIFNKPKVHNWLKLSLLCSSGINDRFEIISCYMEKKNDLNTIGDYAKWRLIGATHRQITKSDDLKEDEETKEAKALGALTDLAANFVYNEHYELAIKQLLRLNVDEDNKLERKFDFSIWKNKSLEHIYPKSKVYHKEEEKNGDVILKVRYKNGNNDLLGETKPEGSDWISRDDFQNNGTEHCIGNLLLLYGKENSEFGAKNVTEKKKTYFNIEDEFKSRHLLHTIAVFANENWGINEIQKNKAAFIERFEKDYMVQLKGHNNNE